MKPKRLVLLDFAKAMSIIFMVFVHVFEVSLNSGALQFQGPVDTFFRNVIEFAGGVLSAGIFVFIMGFLVGNSSSKTSEKLLKEALKLFLLGLLVNVFQQWVPILFRGNIVGDFMDNAPGILATDIYFFDALCMLCLALVFCFRERIRVWIALALIVAAGGLNFLFGSSCASTGNVWLDTVLGLFVRINKWSYFPLCTWLLFPFAGYILGYIYRTKENYNKVFLGCVAAGVVLIVAGSIFMGENGIRNAVCFGTPYTEGDYYAMTTPNQLVALGMIFVFMFLYGLIVEKCCPTEIPKFMSLMSVNVSDVYVIQWMLIGLLTYPLERITNIYVNMLAALLVLLATLLLTRLKKKWTENQQA